MEMIVGLSIAGFVALVIIGVLIRVAHKRLVKRAIASRFPEYVKVNVPDDEGKNAYYRVEITDLERMLSRILGDRMLDFSIINKREISGQGQFGIVYRAEMKGRDVAVKTIKTSEGCTEDQLSEFLQEGLLMKDFDHPNVLNLIGVALHDDIPHFVVPYMANKDLKEYVRDPEKRITVRHLMGLCLQVAHGMAYLADQKFVHRDLAARNCMVSADIVVKIADFGLSRDIYSETYYRITDHSKPLPVRWMAIESLVDGKFSSMSDVWSFGILSWEVMTRGGFPYADIDSYMLKALIISGHRPDKPEYCPQQLYIVMWDCWHLDPYERPTFPEIAADISNILGLNEDLRSSFSTFSGSSFDTLYESNVRGHSELHIDDNYLSPKNQGDLKQKHQNIPRINLKNKKDEPPLQSPLTRFHRDSAGQPRYSTFGTNSTFGRNARNYNAMSGDVRDLNPYYRTEFQTFR
ncbi:unnamed protein product [Owenia fusiformis]|uniref:receptor protein-tyrosine kinase n=1 Tax=Owenia fusiformis TaxID=6347 RepID=A0A8S4PSU5_OWEFU|nr:unnamed protein product [Owenia fusiformis]